MQTIIGANGSVGKVLAKELKNYTNEIKLVSRNPKKINDSDILMKADLLNSVLLDEAVKGSEVVYVTIAFEYKISVWKENWPKFMLNLIESCKKHNSKIVFIDNIYMYDPKHLSNMTEETPINPISEKGKVRAQIAKMLLDAINKNEVTGIIARSADFYGPNVENSALTLTVYNNLLKNKNPQWIGKLDVIHSFTNIIDIGKSAAILGNTKDAFNQIWHLPTTEEKLTSRKWIEIYMQEMQMKKNINAIPAWAIGPLGIFIPILKELKEMAYQYEMDYFFNSTKFNKQFNYKPKTPLAGIKEIIGTK